MEKTKKQPLIRTTHKIDATDKIVGRLATRVATLLRGKHKPTFQPHIDAGDVVIVTNASKVKFSGQKALQKKYMWYSGYPGGLKTRGVARQMETDPTEVLRNAVYHMLPSNRLRPSMMKRLIFQK